MFELKEILLWYDELTGVNSFEEVCSLFVILNICVYEQRVGLGVDILHHDLEPIETACLGYLHLSAEPLHQVFIDDAIRSGEEGENMGDKIALVVIHSVVPIMQILGQINLFGCPE